MTCRNTAAFMRMWTRNDISAARWCIARNPSILAIPVGEEAAAAGYIPPPAVVSMAVAAAEDSERLSIR